MKHLLAPSVLAADFSRLGADIQMINESTADWFHIDIMDGVFVPNISFGFPVLKAIQQQAEKPLDVHLMIVEPDRYLKQFKTLGADVITVHYEACPHLHRTVQHIRDLGCKAGVALNPHTPVSLLSEILPDLDLVLIMSVNPGFGGQSFIEHSLDKIRRLRQMAERLNPNLIIEVDGGVNLNNTLSLLQAGADVLVAGNAVFASSDPKQTIADFKSITLDSRSI